MKQDISALLDGELDDDAAARLIKEMASNEELRDHWLNYHLIGDCLRGSGVFRAGLCSRVCARLAQEPTVLAPPSRRAVRRRAAVGFALAASLAAVSGIAWLAIERGGESGSLLAQSRPPAVRLASGPSADAAAVERMRDLVQAHEEFSNSPANYSSALQRVSAGGAQ